MKTKQRIARLISILTMLAAASQASLLMRYGFDEGTTALVVNNGTSKHRSNVLDFTGTVDASGTMATNSAVVSPLETTTYILNASNETARTSRQVTVTLARGAIDVYLLGGQSNMQGVGRKSKLPADLFEIPEILLYHSTGVSSGQPANTWITLCPAGWSGTASGGFGLEIGFGERLLEGVPAGTKIAFIKHAVGGTSLEIDWKPGANSSDTANWGPQFSTFVNTVDAGLAALVADGYQPRIKGMVWHQGEQDAKEGVNAPESADSATDYGANIAAFIARIREQFSASAGPFGIRFVLAQVLQYAPSGGDVQTRFSGYLTVRQAELDADQTADTALSVYNTATVATDSATYPSHEQEQDGYRDTDEIHMNAVGQLALGRAMADKMLESPPPSAHPNGDGDTSDSISQNTLLVFAADNRLLKSAIPQFKILPPYQKP